MINTYISKEIAFSIVMAQAIKEYYKYPKHEGGKTFWNVSNYLSIDKASCPSNLESSWVTFGGPQIFGGF